MYFVFGHRLYGKVDAVPGIGHVATKFFHVDYLPLIPTECWLVFAQNGKAWRGIRIPMSLKSISVAWARFVFCAIGIAGVVMILVGAIDRSAGNDVMVPGIAAALVGWGLFVFSKKHRWMTRASYHRAWELGRLAKLDTPGMASISAAYGRPPIRDGFELIQVGPVLDTLEVIGAEEDDDGALPVIPL